ncbi:MAG: tRNA (guanosine(46)-N7)-methyltransferase TrmB [Leptolyngbyaceae cyanobacterium MO_188.B28]|nr:tRNA (guanosine(46)-N7)-methyltransferase TrmB [Leptolyngbyaceae cyanobacterium MO_188.B28]
MAVIRVRQHVNPLSQKYQRPIEPPDWSQVYGNLDQPLHLDIGCGKGHFLLQMAQLQPEWNFLGLEIREPLVHQALERRDQLALANLHYLFGNANISLESLFKGWPTHRLQRVSIQFPDPWFKKRHRKRRVVQSELVTELARLMPSAGTVILQSDVEEVARAMCDRFQENPAFARSSPDWLADSPLPAMTDREKVTLGQGKPVYRAVFKREGN